MERNYMFVRIEWLDGLIFVSMCLFVVAISIGLPLLAIYLHFECGRTDFGIRN